MNPGILMLINAITALLALNNNGQFAALKDDTEKLAGKMMAALPAKEDGTDWSYADVQLAAAAARLPWQAILDRTGG